MARDHARLKLAIWRDTDFRERSIDAKFLYFSLLCAPKLSWCGSLDYSPKQLATLDASYNATKVRRIVKELVAHRYVLVDDKTDEIAIRSFIRHDGVLNSPNVAKAMGKALSSLLSPQIRDGLLTELARLHDEIPDANGWQSFAEAFPDLFAEVVAKGSGNPSGKGSGKGSANPSAPRARASRASSPSPLPLPLPTTSALVPSGGDPEATAGKLIGEWLKARGTENRPPARVIGQVSRELKQMLDEGIPYEVARSGFVEWAARNLHPSTLPSVVDEVRNGGRKNAPKPSTTDQRVGQGVDVMQRMAELDAADDQLRGIA